MPTQASLLGHRFVALVDEPPVPGPGGSSASAAAAAATNKLPRSRSCCLCSGTVGPFLTVASRLAYCKDFDACDDRRGAFNSSRAEW